MQWGCKCRLLYRFASIGPRGLQTKALRKRRQVPIPVPGDDHQVFDSYGADGGIVEAGLDGDNVVLDELDVDESETRRFVDIETYTVSGGVDETGARALSLEPGCFEYGLYGPVHVASVGSGSDLSQGCLLRSQHGIVHAL